jgi:DNA integrity scanning protein DisA with diadenylate cyclase activity
VVRVVGDNGVLRWDGLTWHHEPPVDTWIDSIAACGHHGDREVITKLLEFAVHDLGARGIGAIFVYRPDFDPQPTYEVRLPTPPPLRIDRPADLAPLRHVMGQIDGAAVLDVHGTLRELGVRLVPSAEAESDVAGFRGMRHTAGRRYSFDEPNATVVVVSEDGPVTVLRNGELIGRSETRGAAESDDSPENALIREDLIHAAMLRGS